MWPRDDRGAEIETPLGEADSLPAGDVSGDPAGLPTAGSAEGLASDERLISDDTLTEDEEERYARRQAGPIDEPQFQAIMGTAGTGKSYEARKRVADYDDAILCATTGIAAVNVEGTTINSILRYYDTASLRAEYEFGRLNVALKQLAGSGFTRVLIDEISMMDGNQLDILCLAIDEVNEGLLLTHKKPIGVTLVGDFAQLAPVKAPFVFEKSSWARFEEHTTVLTEPRRQADPEFVRALQAVRRGDKEAAAYFRPMISPTGLGSAKFDGTTIAATNVEVDRINKLRMIDINKPEHKYIAVRTGDIKQQASEWKHIPDVLVLKPECLVMCLANFRNEGDPELVYANGDLGHYLGPLTPDNPRSDVLVKLKRNGETVRVRRIVRERKSPTGNTGEKAPREVKVASIEYLPLRVAYASTVHKSQGLSLDEVQLMINSQFWMTPGMLYVALSRARTPQGLKIVGTLDQFVARISANPLINRWL